jgi:hypothetical protein
VEELTLDFEVNYILKHKQVQEKKVYCLPSLFFAKLKLSPLPFKKMNVCVASFKRNECVLLHISQNENLPPFPNQSNLQLIFIIIKITKSYNFFYFQIPKSKPYYLIASLK